MNTLDVGSILIKSLSREGYGIIPVSYTHLMGCGGMLSGCGGYKRMYEILSITNIFTSHS